MDDKQLNATLKAHSEAFHQYFYFRDPASSQKKPVLSAQAQAALQKLRAEADRVRDPGGPIRNYGDALDIWAETNHPQIDADTMSRYVIRDLMTAHR